MERELIKLDDQHFGQRIRFNNTEQLGQFRRTFAPAGTGWGVQYVWENDNTILFMPVKLEPGQEGAPIAPSTPTPSAPPSAEALMDVEQLKQMDPKQAIAALADLLPNALEKIAEVVGVAISRGRSQREKALWIMQKIASEKQDALEAAKGHEQSRQWQDWISKNYARIHAEEIAAENRAQSARPEVPRVIPKPATSQVSDDRRSLAAVDLGVDSI